MENDLNTRLKNLVLRHVDEHYLKPYILNLYSFYDSFCNKKVPPDEDLASLAMGLFDEFHNPTRINLREEKQSVKTDKLTSDDVTVVDDFFEELLELDLDETESEVVIEVLTELEKNLRMYYKPDTETPVDEFLLYILVAVQLTLLKKERDGYSDDVIGLLEESGHVIQWFEKEWGALLQFTEDTISGYTPYIATAASLAMIELFQLRCHDGKYENAVNWFAKAIRYEDVGLPYRGFGPRLNIRPQKIVDAFENLRTADNAKDWKLVTLSCEDIGFFLNKCFEECYLEETLVRDGEGYELQQSEFWEGARNWAKAQLSPSQLIELRKKEEQEQSEKRIIKYILDKSLWDILPERAKEKLVEAEKTWFSVTEVGGESIFNAIRIVVEEVIFSFIWEPLCTYNDKTKINGQSLLDFSKLRQKLQEDNKLPALPHFEEMLRTKFFKQYISKRLPEEDQKFLTDRLPGELGYLRKMRKDAEHGLGKTWGKDEIKPLFRRYLGLGCEGILPQLLGIVIRLNNTE